MKSQLLSQFPMTALSTFALLIFVTFFVGLLIQLNRRGYNDYFSRIAALPLDVPPQALAETDLPLNEEGAGPGFYEDGGRHER